MPLSVSADFFIGYFRYSDLFLRQNVYFCSSYFIFFIDNYKGNKKG